MVKTQTFVVRIYHQLPNEPEGCRGTVEVVGGDKELSFRSFDELRAILTQATSGAQSGATRGTRVKRSHS